VVGIFDKLYKDRNCFVSLIELSQKEAQPVIGQGPTCITRDSLSVVVDVLTDQHPHLSNNKQ